MQSAHRLRRRSDFARVMRHGSRITGEAFVLHYVARDGPGPARVGFSVPRRIGGAVTRNRARRLLREAVRPLCARLEPSDVVVAARPEIVNLRPDELRAALAGAAARSGLILSTS